MNLKKIITNTLAVVGAVVVIDKIVEVVTTKGTRSICDTFNNEDNDYDLDSCCECDCTDSEESCTESQCEEDCSSSQEETFPHIEKYEDDKNHSFEYTIQGENITSQPKEV